jgi:hypothetical protein
MKISVAAEIINKALIIASSLMCAEPVRPCHLALVQVYLIHSKTDGSRAADDRRSLFDAVPFGLSLLVAPCPQSCTQHAEGVRNGQGKKSVKEAHSYRIVPIFRLCLCLDAVGPDQPLAIYLTQIKAAGFVPAKQKPSA